MMQLALFDALPQTPPPADPARAQHGHQWKTGNWHHRNHHGFYQCREGQKGNWRFYVPWFANDDLTCTVNVIDETGAMQHRDGIPIDDKGRITIRGRKYGRAFWDH